MRKVEHVVVDNNYHRCCIVLSRETKRKREWEGEGGGWKRGSLRNSTSNYPSKVYHGPTQEMSDRANFGGPLLPIMSSVTDFS